jgi:hypothetical protein
VLAFIAERQPVLMAAESCAIGEERVSGAEQIETCSAAFAGMSAL